MNILFDQTEAQASFFNGAAEYAQAVFTHLVSKLSSYPDVKVFCLYSSDKSFRYEKLKPECFPEVSQVKYVDYKGKTLADIVKSNAIDLLFVTCAQAFCDLPLGNLNSLGCKVTVVIHDLLDEEMDNSKVQLLKMLDNPKLLFRHLLGRLHVRLKAGSMQSRTAAMRNLIQNNDTSIVTVSEYTKNTIEYNYPTFDNNIYVYAAPAKIASTQCGEIENSTLRELVENGERYMLLLSADRPLKNAKSMLKAFIAYCKHTGSDVKLVTVGYGNKEFCNHVPLPFLSVSDLEIAYRNCHALLYPSLFEGFGYPPIEAMKYHKPVLSSNVCSMQEVLMDAPVYFSPIYESDMYRALSAFSKMPYDDLCQRSYSQYLRILEKQSADLDALVEKILKNEF